MEHQTPSGFPGNFRKRKVLGTLWFPSELPPLVGAWMDTWLDRPSAYELHGDAALTGRYLGRGAASAASCCGGVSTERASGVSRTCAIGESVEG